MKSYPETGGYSSNNYESSLNSLVNSPSLIQQMSQLQSSGSGAKFPELSITKHESKASEDNSGLQIIPRTSAASTMMETGVIFDGGVKNNMDIQEQINMLRNMPDLMKMNTNSAVETDEVEELSEEDGSPLHQEDDRQLHVSGHVNHVDTSIATP